MRRELRQFSAQFLDDFGVSAFLAVFLELFFLVGEFAKYLIKAFRGAEISRRER